MSWNLANPNGILASGSTQNTSGVKPPQFNAGTINGIIHYVAQPDSSSPQPAITLVSTPTSGVWKLDNPDKGTWISLSQSWKRPDINCLVKGGRDVFDVFAAGGGIDGQGTLWENGDWSGDFAGAWNNIDLSLLETGAVNGITVITQGTVSFLVLACDQGIWWSILPPGLGGTYSFKKAITPVGVVDRWSSVAPGSWINPGSPGFGKFPPSSLWAAPWGQGSSQAALFRGFLNRVDPSDPTADMELVAMDQSSVPAGNQTIFRVLLCAAPSEPQNRLLIGGGADGSIAFVWRMKGLSPPTWETAGTTVGGIPNALINPTVTGLLGNWAGGIAFSEVNANTIVLGWQSGYFLSTDYGSNWTRIDANNSPNIHPGIHAVQFIDENTLQQKSLALATDGGLFTTTDSGHTHISTANQTFPNLKFANGALDNHSIGIVTGSLSNDLNLYASVYGLPQLWQPLRNNDVGPVAYLRNGMLLDYDNLQPTNSSSLQSVLQARLLDPFNRPPGYTRFVDPLVFNDLSTAPGSGPNIDVSMNLRPLEPVDVPSTVDINSESLVAVAGRQFEVCGTILHQQDALHDNIAVHILGSPTLSTNEVITAVASPDGQSVIVGTNQGNFFIGNPVPGASSFSFNFVPMAFSPPPPSLALPITKISALNDNRRFAIAKGTQLFRLEGSGWSPIPKPHVLEEFTSLLAVPSESSLFVSTPSRIFQSKDDGSTWTNISAGLPAFSHITDMKHIKEPGGASILYLFTDGWSIFRRILNQPTIPVQRAVTIKGVMGITYNDNTENFNISDGALLGFNQGVWVFKFVKSNGNVFADMTIRATFREDESVEVLSSLWLYNFASVNDHKTLGTPLVLDPGSSYYQNVNVTLGDGRGDTDGGVVDFDFLVTN